MSRVVAVVPALDEEAAIGDVVRGVLPRVDEVIVVDNGSRDRTGERAREAGAIVVVEPERGYGAACHAGMAEAERRRADVVLFLDGDGSDDPNDVPRVLAPILSGEAELVLGIRTRRSTERGAMTPVQRFGNWLAPLLLRRLVGANVHDMPPFKAIALPALARLPLRDRGHGFTIELLVLAHRARLRIVEVEVRCRVRRGGTSKVSGTIGGSTRAAMTIVTTIARHARRRGQ